MALVGVAGPASADPLTSGGALGYGAQVSGTLLPNLIPPTPLAVVNTVPADVTKPLINLPVDPLLVSVTLSAQATTSVDSSLPTTVPGTTVIGAGALPSGWNARGFTRAEGLKILTTPAVAGVSNGVSLVSADVLQSEAVAACVAGKVVLGGSTQVIGLSLGGQPQTVVDNLVTTLLGTVNNITSPLNVHIIKDEKGTKDGGATVFFNALHVSVLGTDAGNALLDVVIGHAEASATACGPLATTPPSVAPNNLATTGGTSFFDTGSALLVGALMLLMIVRKSGRREHPITND